MRDALAAWVADCAPPLAAVVATEALLARGATLEREDWGEDMGATYVLTVAHEDDRADAARVGWVPTAALCGRLRAWWHSAGPEAAAYALHELAAEQAREAGVGE